MKVLTPGEKLIKIRKMIGASQQDLAGTQITRNLISQIENDKIKLTRKTASKIVDNINSFCQKHKFNNINTTVDYLIESNEEQVLRITNNYIDELNEIKVQDRDKQYLLEKIKEIECFLLSNNVDLKKKANILKLISDIYMNLKMINESAFNMTLGIEAAYRCRDYETVIGLILEDTKRDYDNDNTQDNQLKALRLGMAIYEENGIQNELLYKRLCFNIALRYFKIKNYNNCINYLNRIEKNSNLSTKEKLDIELLKATCYEDSRNYDEAELLYLKILHIALEQEKIVTVSKIYNSLGTLYRLKCDKVNSLKYISASLLIKNNIPERNYTRTLYFSLENFIKLDMKEEVSKYYRATINALETSNNESKYKDIITLLYSYFKSYNLDRDIDYLLTKVEVSIKNGFIEEDGIINLFFKYGYDLRLSDNYKSESVMKKGIELINLIDKNRKVSKF